VTAAPDDPGEAGADVPVVIREGVPDDPRLAALIDEHLAEMRPSAPPESRHALAVADVAGADVQIWVAESGADLVGSVALKRIEPGHVELKTMRVSYPARGRGIGQMLLLHALDRACATGATRISLETGRHTQFEPARSLYRAHGFAECPPFGTYRLDPHSVFLTREL
jgi:putative acetyltransferase